MHGCFDERPELLQEFSAAFCGALECVDGVLQHRAPPESAIRERSSLWSKFSFMLFAVPHFFLFIGTFYAVVLLYNRESTVQDDLQQLSVKRRVWQLKWMQRGKKVKAY